MEEEVLRERAEEVAESWAPEDKAAGPMVAGEGEAAEGEAAEPVVAPEDEGGESVEVAAEPVEVAAESAVSDVSEEEVVAPVDSLEAGGS